jgi:hypothetical protein
MLLIAGSYRASGTGHAGQYFLASLIVSPKSVSSTEYPLTRALLFTSSVLLSPDSKTGGSMTDLLNLGDVELETRRLKGTVFTFLGALIPLRGWRSCQWKVCKQGSLLTEPSSPSLGFPFAVVLAFPFSFEYCHGC